jgi:hypothetical protein
MAPTAALPQAPAPLPAKTVIRRPDLAVVRDYNPQPLGDRDPSLRAQLASRRPD